MLLILDIMITPSRTIIEDVKSVATKTPVYNLKKILATYTPPIEIVEIF